MICSRRGECWPRWLNVSSAGSAMIAPRPMVVQLRLDLAESSAPAEALWELVGDEQRQAACTLLVALIAQTVVGEAAGDELATLGDADGQEDG